MPDSASPAMPADGIADDHGAMGHGTLDPAAVHRRRFLKLGGATLLAGGAVASTAAAKQPAAARTAVTGTTAETANTASTGGPSSTAVSSTAESDVPVDAQSLVPIPASRIPAAVAKLDSIIDYVLAQTGVPGLAAAVVHSGQVLYAKGFGVKDVNSTAAVDAGTVFRLASVSKPLSATVVAGIVGQDVVKWTDPIVGAPAVVRAGRSVCHRPRDLRGPVLARVGPPRSRR